MNNFIYLLHSFIDFFPISSSGHILLIQNIFNIESFSSNINYFWLHFSSLVAIFFFFRKEIKLLLSHFFLNNFIYLAIFKFKSLKKIPYSWLSFLIFLSTITSGLTFMLVLFIKDSWNSINNFQYSQQELFYLLTGFHLTITAIFILIATFLSKTYKTSYHQIQIKDALLIGFIQGFSIIPGLSRSGLTISLALLCGLNKKISFTYSFLLSVPAILLGIILEFTILSSIPPKNFFSDSSLFFSINQILFAYLGIYFMHYLFVKKKQFGIFALICLFSATISWLNFLLINF